MKNATKTETKATKAPKQGAAEQTAATGTQTKAAKAPKAVDPAVAEAKAKLDAAKAAAKEAEAKAKEQRKAEREAARAAKAAQKAEPRPTCTGTKKDGTPCTAKAKEGSDKCIDHQPAVNRLTDVEAEALGLFLQKTSKDTGVLLTLFVNEVGWFRAKALIRQVRPELFTSEAKAAQAKAA